MGSAFSAEAPGLHEDSTCRTIATRGIRMANPANDFTIGVEVESQILHAETRALTQRAGRVLPAAQETLGDEVTNELFLSQIEIGTPVCRTLAEVREELVRLRRAVIAAAEKTGARIAA